MPWLHSHNSERCRTAAGFECHLMPFVDGHYVMAYEKWPEAATSVQNGQDCADPLCDECASDASRRSAWPKGRVGRRVGKGTPVSEASMMEFLPGVVSERLLPHMSDSVSPDASERGWEGATPARTIESVLNSDAADQDDEQDRKRVKLRDDLEGDAERRLQHTPQAE